jgi:exodeoxyribonuclease V alpha subunit
MGVASADITANEVLGNIVAMAQRVDWQVGLATDGPERIKAGLAYALSEATDDGHCYLPEHLLVAEAAKILGVAEALIAEGVQDVRINPLSWSPVTESNRRPSPYHGQPSLLPACESLS